MSKALKVMFIGAAIIGGFLGYYLIPDSMDVYRRILGGVFSGLGCVLILFMDRIIEPNHNKTMS